MQPLLPRSRSRTVEVLNRLIPWHRLPKWLGLANLAELRETLRAENLHDTSHLDESESSGHAAATVEAPPATADVVRLRTADGSYNDLESPRMGMKGMRFGRNVPLDEVENPDEKRLMTPSPRIVSEALLARREFLPAISLNALAAAWIQFMTRDWFNHGENDPKDPYQVPLEKDDPWPERPMKVRRTRADPTRCPMSGGPRTFTNDVTHWWDGSQIYGSDLAAQKAVRAMEGGRLALDARGRLLVDPATGVELTGFVVDTNWPGISLLHTLFALEHNAIAGALHAAYPSWGDEELFQRARLVNAALLAKIHTVEWTPSLLTHPTITAAMNANWWGIFGERIKKSYGRIVDNEALAGIPGGERDHFGVPYAITEEFVAVYRMHSLMPDELTFRALRDHSIVKRAGLLDVVGPGSPKLIDELGAENVLYSLGVSHPGAMRLHNYPNTLRSFRHLDGTTLDLAAVDVLRDRERGVPRYTKFRRLLHLDVPRTFEELAADPEWAGELKQVYGRIEDVDLLTGMLAEPLPEGMAFGDTAFRVFILMASRRLNSDRFLTTEFTPEVYSQAGMDWVRDNDMKSVLLRHFPALAPALLHVKNAFWPWSTLRLA
jgi:Animal haem peroxidase